MSTATAQWERPSTWSAKLHKYTEIARVNYRNNVTYLWNLLSRSGLVVIRLWIFTQLYQVTYAVAGTNEIGGLTAVMGVWALMLTQSFQGAGKPPIAKTIDEEVKSGTLAYSINRPYSYVLFHLTGFLGRSLPNIVLNVAVGTVAALILIGPMSFSISGIILGILLLFLGFILDFFISMIIGLAAFWVEDTTPFVWIYQKSQTIFGGVILPLALFPDKVRLVAEHLPFSQLYYGAARIAVRFDTRLFWQYITTQLAWIAFFAIVAFYVYHRGIKQVSINGG